MNCPICGTTLEIVEGNSFCPSCKLFIGGQIDPTEVQESLGKDDLASVFQNRQKKYFVKNLLTWVTFISIILVLGYLFVMNFTSFGYREKVFDNYNFTKKAQHHLRSKTQIEIVFLGTKNPIGLTHSGFWSPASNTVRLNSASDEVAIHEFAHAWWEEKRKNLSLRKNLVEDTLALSKMESLEYSASIKRALDIVNLYCACPNGVPSNLSGVDDHHFYAFMAEFTMGNFKSGPHKLPKFMWEYFSDLFVGKTTILPCYETKSCSFSWNNL